jgi:hypothetical protein
MRNCKTTYRDNSGEQELKGVQAFMCLAKRRMWMWESGGREGDWARRSE